jgi:hypothetical protein
VVAAGAGVDAPIRWQTHRRLVSHQAQADTVQGSLRFLRSDRVELIVPIVLGKGKGDVRFNFSTSFDVRKLKAF